MGLLLMKTTTMMAAMTTTMTMMMTMTTDTLFLIIATARTWMDGDAGRNACLGEWMVPLYAPCFTSCWMRVGFSDTVDFRHFVHYIC